MIVVREQPFPLNPTKKLSQILVVLLAENILVTLNAIIGRVTEKQGPGPVVPLNTLAEIKLLYLHVLQTFRNKSQL